MFIALSVSDRYPDYIRLTTVVDHCRPLNGGFKLLRLIPDPQAPLTISTIMDLLGGRVVPFRDKCLNLVKCDMIELTDTIELNKLVVSIIKEPTTIPSPTSFYYHDELSSLTKLDLGKAIITNTELRLLVNLVELRCRGNPYIGSLNHLRKLEVLDVSDTAIKQGQIDRLHNLRELYCAGTTNILDVNFALDLTVLDISNSRVDQRGIYQLTKLEKLLCYNNRGIRKVSHLSQLKHLDIGGSCGVCFGLGKLTNLRTLHCRNNSRVTRVSVNLTELDAGGRCGITQQSIEQLTKLTTINVDNNPNVVDLSKLKHLSSVSIRGKCGVDQKGVVGLDLIVLDASNNPKITDVYPFPNLEKLYIEGVMGYRSRYVRNGWIVIIGVLVTSFPTTRLRLVLVTSFPTTHTLLASLLS